MQIRSICVAALATALAAVTTLAGPLASFARAGTLVTINTNLGVIQVDLFNEVTPETVQNFVSYISAGTYTDTIIHRSPPGFVVQGGGFNKDFSAVATNAPIALDYQLTNARGTIAMARSGEPNSATSQWYINVGDNSVDLAPREDDPNTTADEHSDGYAVFGWVVAGMDVVDAINDVPVYNGGGAFTSLPLKDYDNSQQVTDANKIIVNGITVSAEHPSFQNPIDQFDVNNDGRANSSDLLAIINDLIAAGEPHSAAQEYITDTYKYFDPNADGRVNSSDMLAIINHMLATQADPQMAVPLAAVPEPSSMALLAVGLAGLAGFAIRRRKTAS